MHLPKLTQEKRQHHDARNDGELRRLKIDRPQMEPAARAVNLRSEKLGQIPETRAPRSTSVTRPTESSDSRSSS